MRRLLLVVVAAGLAGCHREPTAGELFAEADREVARDSSTAVQRAIPKLQRALRLEKDPAAQARIHARLADAWLIIDPERSEIDLRESVRLAGLAGDRELLLLRRAWLVYWVVKGKDNQIAQLRALVTEAGAAGARRAELVATALLGEMLVTVHKPSDAIPILTGALELARVTPDARTEASLEWWLAAATFMLNDPDQALAHYQRALAIAHATPLPIREAKAALGIGSVYMWLHLDPARALIWYSRSLVGYAVLGLVRMNSGLDARLNVATAQSRLGDPAGALATLTTVLADERALGQETSAVVTLLAIGEARSALGQSAEARQAYAEAAAMSEQLDLPQSRALALAGSVRLDLKEHRWRDAEQTLGVLLAFAAAKEAAVTDEPHRLSYSAAMRNAQALLLDALAGQEDWTRAFATSERLRSRRLLAALGSGEIVDGAGAQALLDADTTLVEYAFSDSRLIAFVVDARSIQGIDLGPAKAVERAARGWYEVASAATSAPGALEAATRTLADQILTPLVPRLHGRRLVIVPDRSLHYVAFAALALPDGTPLIERFELVHVPSASVLRELRRRGGDRPRPTRELAILADPIFDRGDARVGGPAPPAALVAMRTADAPADLVRLPSTHAEAEAIAALVPPGRLFLAEGLQATRAAALGPEVAGARLVHLATHAVLDNSDPARSGLVFSQVDAGGAAIEGLLRVADIEQTHLAAELVVLSACRTAIGKSFDGEGLVGLTRAFLRAGVPRVVSSLWQVDDVATADLMARFYRGLLAEHLSAPEALRRAQLAAGVTRHAAARLWAGFAFYGDWR